MIGLNGPSEKLFVDSGGINVGVVYSIKPFSTSLSLFSFFWASKKAT
jgi:hypothetical protein